MQPHRAPLKIEARKSETKIAEHLEALEVLETLEALEALFFIFSSQSLVGLIVVIAGIIARVRSLLHIVQI
jgi:hypothetical protein